MKSLFFGIVLIILIGTAGFFYRNVMETAGAPEPVACTMDAKMCPDGTGVGRTGPSCEFSPCPFPNAEDAEIGISFVIPEGYVANADAIGADSELRAVFDKSAPGGLPHNIVIRHFPIPEGKTAEDVMVGETIFETADMGAESMDDLMPVIINNRTFYMVTVERFEAQIHTLNYLPRASDVVRFEVLERDVTEWMEPSLVVTELPEHAALLELLGTLQSN